MTEIGTAPAYGVHFDRLPQTLTAQPRWLLWKYVPKPDREKPSKVPCTASGHNASVDDPATWRSVTNAEYALGRFGEENELSGVGYVLRPGEDLFIDVDDGVGLEADGKTIHWRLVENLTRRLGTYAEWSPSKTGIHILGLGAVSSGMPKKYLGKFFEVYGAGRYATMTGEPLVEATADVTAFQPQFDEFFTVLQDWAAALDKLRGDDREDFRDLIKGCLHRHDGDRSKNDYWLCRYLVRGLGNDQARLDAAFRWSGLFREKWDELHGQQTYGEMTLERAIADEQTRQTQASGQQGRNNQPDLLDIARLLPSELGDTLAYDTVRGYWRKWTGAYWQVVEHVEELSLPVAEVMQQHGKPVHAVRSTTDCLKLAAPLMSRPFRATPGLISFSNGTYEVESDILREHRREDDLSHGVPYPFVRGGDYPTIQQFFVENVPDIRGIQAIMTHVGLALLGDTSFQRCVVLIGGPGSGKSTALDLALAVVGKPAGNYAGAELFRDSTEGLRTRVTWSTAPLVALDELPEEALRQDDMFKSMSAHKGVPMRQMYERENRENRWLPKLMFATNNPPVYIDRTGATTRRLLYVKFPHARREDEQQDKQLFDAMLPEVPAFAQACLRIAQWTLENERYPESDAMRQHRYQVAEDADPVKMFIADRLVLDPGHWESSQAVYQSYRDFAEALTSMPVGANKLISTIVSAFEPRVERMRQDGHTRKPRGLIGIRLLGEEEREQLTIEPLSMFTTDTPAIENLDEQIRALHGPPYAEGMDLSEWHRKRAQKKRENAPRRAMFNELSGTDPNW